jgi:hypothetical protein
MWNSTKISGPYVWPVDPTFQRPMSFHHGYALQESVEWNPGPRVGGGRAP